MRYPHANEYQLQNPEIVLNLWAYASEDGYIVRLAGKSYVLDGSDEDKLRILRKFSATDFLSAIWQKVPENFQLTYTDGRQMPGVAAVSALSDPYEHSHLFGSLIEKLATTLPEQICSINGEYRKVILDLPEIPLTVTTLVIEHEDGRLVPMISQ